MKNKHEFYDEELEDLISKEDPSLYLMDDVEFFMMDEQRNFNELGIGDLL